MAFFSGFPGDYPALNYPDPADTPFAGYASLPDIDPALQAAQNVVRAVNQATTRDAIGRGPSPELGPSPEDIAEVQRSQALEQQAILDALPSSGLDIIDAYGEPGGADAQQANFTETLLGNLTKLSPTLGLFNLAVPIVKNILDPAGYRSPPGGELAFFDPDTPGFDPDDAIGTGQPVGLPGADDVRRHQIGLPEGEEDAFVPLDITQFLEDETPFFTPITEVAFHEPVPSLLNDPPTDALEKFLADRGLLTGFDFEAANRRFARRPPFGLPIANTTSPTSLLS